MSKKIACAWLPTEATWPEFLERVGVAADAPLGPGDTRALTHAAAVDVLVELLANSGERELWLILSTPFLAQSATHDTKLATQEGRAEAAIKLAERSDHVLGLALRPGAIGFALVSEGHRRWKFETLEIRGRVRIVHAIAT